MKVTELFEESRWLYRRRLTRKLKIKRLGGGAYADVFQHPQFPDIAVKAFDARDDTAYESYLEWAILHQHNRYVPPIIDWIRVKNEKSKEDYNWENEVNDIVFFKKLVPVKKNQIKNEAVYFVHQMGDLYNRQRQDSPWKAEKYEPGEYIEFENFSQRDWNALTKAEDHDVAEIASFFSKNVEALDLHDRNIMMHNGQLVFTDPVAA